MNKRVLSKRLLALLLALLVSVPAAWAAETGEESETLTPAPAEELLLPGEPTASADWSLLLVNPRRPLTEEYTFERTALANGMEVDKRIYDDLNALLIHCWAAGLRPRVCSAYRSEATQSRLYHNKVARLRAAGYSRSKAELEAARWVALPGTSEHQTGLALDLVSSDDPNLTAKQAKTPEQQWLMEHCWEYGFILRYPAAKTTVTGIGYEPWHYRYVGRPAALAMRDSGLCLEEYLLMLPEAETPAAQETPETPEITPVQQAQT